MGGELINVWGLLYWYTLGPVVLLETYIDVSGCFHIFPDHVHLFMTIMFLVSYGYVQQENSPFHRARFITEQIGLRNNIPRFEFFIDPNVSVYICAYVGQSGMIWLKLRNTTI